MIEAIAYPTLDVKPKVADLFAEAPLTEVVKDDVPQIDAHYEVVSFPFSEAQIERIEKISELLEQTTRIMNGFDLTICTESQEMQYGYCQMLLSELLVLFSSRQNFPPRLSQEEVINQKLYTTDNRFSYHSRNTFQSYEQAYGSLAAILKNVDRYPHPAPVYALSSIAQVLQWFHQEMHPGL
jgi:hypothetical protein